MFDMYTLTQDEIDREVAIDEASAELTQARDEEIGSCDSCQVAYINDTRCHEIGCPRWERLKWLKVRLANLEDDY